MLYSQHNNKEKIIDYVIYLKYQVLTLSIEGIFSCKPGLFGF